MRVDFNGLEAGMTYDMTKLKVELKLMTPGEARGLRDAMPYDRQRKEDQSHIEFLMDQTSQGYFLAGTQVHICVLPDGTGHIVNGNHTLEQIARGKVSVPLTVLYQKVRNEEEMHRIYARHDSHRPRNLEARLRAAGQGIIFDVSGRWLETMSASALILARNLTYATTDVARKSLDGRIAAMEDWKSELQIYLGYIATFRGATSNKTICRRSALVASCVYAIRYQPSAAEDFIRGIIEDDGLGRDDPRKRLLEWCRENRYTGSNVTEHILRVRKAWNLHFKGETVSRFYGCKPEDEMLGTPLNRAAVARPRQSALKLGHSVVNGRPTTTGFVSF